jgi:putative membrane protein
MKKKFNINEFIWFLILLSFSLYFYNLLHTSKIDEFINPKLIKYSYFTLGALIIFTLFQISNIFSKRRSKVLKKGYALFFIPLFLGVVVNPRGFDTAMAHNKGVNIDQSFFHIIHEDFTKGNKINITEENFFDAHTEIVEKVDKYSGKEISLQGFIYTNKKFKCNQFVVARMAISFCAADGQVIGFLSETDKAQYIKANQWVKVDGVIDKTTATNNDGKKYIIPIIKIKNFEYIKEPVNKYVYN